MSISFPTRDDYITRLDQLPTELLYSVLENLDFWEQFHVRGISQTLRDCIDECGLVRRSLKRQHHVALSTRANSIILDQPTSEQPGYLATNRLVATFPRRYAGDAELAHLARVSPGTLGYVRLFVPRSACRTSISELWLGDHHSVALVSPAASLPSTPVPPLASSSSSSETCLSSSSPSASTQPRRRVVLFAPTDTLEDSDSSSPDSSSSSSSDSFPLSPQLSETEKSSLERTHLMRYATCAYLGDLSQLVDLRGLEHLVCVWVAGCTALRDLTPLAGVFFVELSFCDVEELAPLCEVHSVHLSNCDRVRDLSCLTGVHTLHLEGMDLRSLNLAALEESARCLQQVKVVDCQLASALGFGGAHTVDLTGCRLLVDVQSLHRCHTLRLACCSELKQVAALRSVHTLDLSNCSQLDLEEVAQLGDVYSLNLSCTSLRSGAGLGRVHTLTLDSCAQLSSVAPLAGVHTLSLKYCSQLERISSLSGLHSLDLTSCGFAPEELDQMGGLHTIVLSGCQQVHDVACLGQVHTLDVQNCYRLHTRPEKLLGVTRLLLPSCRAYRRLMKRRSSLE